MFRNFLASVNNGKPTSSSPGAFSEANADAADTVADESENGEVLSDEPARSADHGSIETEAVTQDESDDAPAGEGESGADSTDRADSGGSDELATAEHPATRPRDRMEPVRLDELVETVRSSPKSGVFLFVLVGIVALIGLVIWLIVRSL
jgi:hypothetical protein